MRFWLFKIVIVVLFVMPAASYAETPHLDGEDYFNETVEKGISGTLTLNPIDLLNNLSDKIFVEVRECIKNVMILLIIAAISGFVTTMSSTFKNKSVTEASFFACFTLMSITAVKCFETAMNYGRDVIMSMTTFVTKLSPLFMLTLVTSGNSVSAMSFSPVLSGAVYVVSIIVEKCLVPLIGYSLILGIVGNINDKIQLSGFCKLVKSLTKWLMAAIVTIFTGVSAIYGFSSSSLDAVGGKTIKFAVGSLVPVVGSFLSDTLETVVSGARLVKNAVGTAGMVVVYTMCIIPIIKIGIIQFMLKLTSSIAEPLTDKRISSMLWEVSEAVTSIFAVVVMTAVLFLINISIILSATNA